MKKLAILAGILIVIGLAGFDLWVFKTISAQHPEQLRLGSVQQGSEYHATTTHSNTQREINLTTTTGNIYATMQGALGSVIITKAGTASFDVYDATTTVQSQRAASMTTNTIRVASFPASAAAGTYTFDEVFYNGLIIVFSSTDIPSTTFTHR